MDIRGWIFIASLLVPLAGIASDAAFYKAKWRGLPWMTLLGVGVIVSEALIFWGG